MGQGSELGKDFEGIEDRLSKLENIIRASFAGKNGADFSIPRNFINSNNLDAGSLPARDPRKIRLLIRQRRQRNKYFGDEIFSEPAWDMLLDLYASHLENRAICISSLCIAASVPATTALRWIGKMSREGLVEREDDPGDGRRVFIRPSQRAIEALDAYFAEVLD